MSSKKLTIIQNHLSNNAMHSKYKLNKYRIDYFHIQKCMAISTNMPYCMLRKFDLDLMHRHHTTPDIHRHFPYICKPLQCQHPTEPVFPHDCSDFGRLHQFIQTRAGLKEREMMRTKHLADE